jgi:cell division protein FtsL
MTDEPTDADDLPARLRYIGAVLQVDPEVEDIAAMLETQAARIRELEAEVDEAWSRCDRAVVEVARLTAERDALKAEVARLTRSQR